MWNPYQPLSKTTRRVASVIAVAAVLFIWTTMSVFVIRDIAVLPTPVDAAKAFWYLAVETDLLWAATLSSLLRVGLASVLVVVIGIPIGIIMGASPKINAVLSPLVDPFRSAPIVAILPLFVMWFGIGESMKILFLFTCAVVYLVPMVRDAIKAVPQEYWISAHDLGATRFEAVRYAVVPMAKPRIADAVIVSVSIIWTYITVAEYVNADKGLGQLLSQAKRFGSMSQVFVGLLVIILLALLTYQGMTALKKKLYPWEIE